MNTRDAKQSGVALVIGSETTQRKLAQRAIETLTTNEPRILAAVLNRVDLTRNKYYSPDTTARNATNRTGTPPRPSTRSWLWARSTWSSAASGRAVDDGI